MDDPVVASEPKALPPMVTILKTSEGCQLTHNLLDPFLLLEMGKDALLTEMKRPKLVQPQGMNGMRLKLGGR